MKSETSSTDYIARTNAAIDHIVNNLSSDLKLEEIAQVAQFSPFHFHRIFRSLLGETLNQFVKRIRLERALYLMSHSPKLTLTDIALDCGFSSSSDFSRNFKAKFGEPPSSFDLQKLRATKRQEFASTPGSEENKHNLKRLPTNENPDGFRVELRELPARHVAYIRVLDPFESNAVHDASQRLVSWAEEGGIELEMRAIDWLYRTWLLQSGCVPDEQSAFEAWHGLPFEHGLEHFELSCQLPVKKG